MPDELTTEKLRIVFMGTPDFAVPALQKLIDSGHDVIAVYSQPPRPKGRGQQVQKSPVHELAEKNSLPVFHPVSFKKDPQAVADFQNLNADLAIVAAYGLILPKVILDAPKYGCVNIHASLLPRWRGASPIQRAIWGGDAVSGVTLMKMDVGLDTGDMMLKREIAITPDMTSQMLHDNLSAMGGDMLTELLPIYGQGKIPDGEKQDETLVTYAHLLKKEDGLIDWSQPAIEIDRQIRALNPWPGTYTFLNGQRLRVLEGGLADLASGDPGQILAGGKIICGDGTAYQITKLQPDNARAMDVTSAINGHYLTAGQTLSRS